MSGTPHSRRAPNRLLGLYAVLYLCASTFFLALPTRAQDSQSAAEAARQQKTRKSAQQKKESHVYTNEDESNRRSSPRRIAPASKPARIIPLQLPANHPIHPSTLRKIPLPKVWEKWPAATAAGNLKFRKPPKPAPNRSSLPASPWISRDLRSPFPSNPSRRAFRQIHVRANP